MTNMEAIALASLVVVILGGLIGVVLFPDKMRRAVERQVDEEVIHLTARMENHIKDDQEAFRLIFGKIGDTEGRLRGKITELELFMRDHFVSNARMDEIMVLVNKNIMLQFELVNQNIRHLVETLERDRQP